MVVGSNLPRGRGGTISTNPVRVKETPPPACFFTALAGGDSLPVAPIYFPFAAAVHLGFASFADFTAEGVRVALVSFSVSPSPLCTLLYFSLSTSIVFAETRSFIYF